MSFSPSCVKRSALLAFAEDGIGSYLLGYTVEAFRQCSQIITFSSE